MIEQMGLFAETVVPEPERESNVAANLAMAECEFGKLIGRCASWMRLYPIVNPPKGATIFVERRRCEGTITGVSGGIYDYLPRLIIEDSQGLHWWIPPTDAEVLEPTPDEILRSGYDPERENGAPRRSAEWNRALGWVDALHDEARAWCETKPTPATVNIVAKSVNSAGLANERKQGEGCGK